MNETTYKAKIIQECRRRGIKVIKTHGGGFTVKGTPDIIGAYRGRVFVLELKFSDNYGLTKKQVHELKSWMTEGGAISLFVDGRVVSPMMLLDAITDTINACIDADFHASGIEISSLVVRKLGELRHDVSR